MSARFERFRGRLTRPLAALLAATLPTALALFPVEGAAGEAYNHSHSIRAWNPDWMRPLSGEKRLGQISLPGTHDTMAYRAGGDAVLTQSLDLRAQLNAGIRFVDIRLVCWNTDKASLYAFHGIQTQATRFDDILDTLKSFLGEHRDETIYARLRNEGSNKCEGFWKRFSQFDEAFWWYYTQDRWQGMFWRKPNDGSLDDSNPRLTLTRGKLVALVNFDTTDERRKLYGLTYSGPFHVQDEFHLKSMGSLYRKWDDSGEKVWLGSVKRSLIAARDRKAAETDGNLNYLSGAVGALPWWVASGQQTKENGRKQMSTGQWEEKYSRTKYPDFPRDCHGSRKVNPRCEILYYGTNKLALEWLEANRTSYTGVLMMDFPGTDLIDKIIRTNSFP